MKLMIRQEKLSDEAEVYRVVSLAFGQELEAKLVVALRLSDAFVPALSLVALMEEEVVGHILFSKIRIVNEDKKEEESLALAPLAVHPLFQRKGIGAKLVERGLEIAQKLHFQSVIVLGHENYYPKFGFVPASTWEIQAPFPVNPKAFMGKELVSGALKHIKGTVKYAKPFEMAVDL
ncbi:MAG: GNAT family N-acetyltransferase [Bacteroidia bacterium]